MKVLVVGAGGFIGTYLCKSKPQEIEMVKTVRKGFVNASTVMNVDVDDRESLVRVFKKQHFDVVIHLAAITEHDAIVNDKFNALNTNINGTMNLLEVFNRYCKGAMFVYASTGKVYGETNEMPISENALIRPMNVLGKSKRITEEIIEYLAIPENKYLICRIFNIYGGYQKRNFVLPTIIDQLDNEIIALGNTKDRRDFLYIDDLVSAIWACVNHMKNFKSLEYVNIGSGEAHSVSEMIHEIEIILGRNLRIRQEEKKMRTDETSVEYADISKIISLTGWEPIYSFTDGIRASLREEHIIR